MYHNTNIVDIMEIILFIVDIEDFNYHKTNIVHIKASVYLCINYHYIICRWRWTVCSCVWC